MQPLTVPAAEVLERARRMGPLPYSARGRNPAPAPPPDGELAAWLVDTVDAWWAEMGRPDPFTLVEIGAGAGTRAAAFLGLGPECLTALRYVLVDDDPAALAQHGLRLPVESPVLVLGPVGDDEAEDDGAAAVEGIGPLLTSLTEPPVVDGPAAVVAVGWVGRLPSDRVEWRDGRWWEVRLAATVAPADGGLDELLVPLDEERQVASEGLVGTAARPSAARYAQLGPAADWLSGALRIAPSGRLGVIDRWTLVTGPLAVGEVPPLAVDQLAAVRRPIEARPEEIFSGWAVVFWRLG